MTAGEITRKLSAVPPETVVIVDFGIDSEDVQRVWLNKDEGLTPYAILDVSAEQREAPMVEL